MALFRLSDRSSASGRSPTVSRKQSPGTADVRGPDSPTETRSRLNDCIRRPRTHAADPLLSYRQQQWTTAMRCKRPIAASPRQAEPELSMKTVPVGKAPVTNADCDNMRRSPWVCPSPGLLAIPRIVVCNLRARPARSCRRRQRSRPLPRACSRPVPSHNQFADVIQEWRSAPTPRQTPARTLAPASAVRGRTRRALFPPCRSSWPACR